MSRKQRKPRPSSPISPFNLYPWDKHKVAELRNYKWDGKITILDELQNEVEDALRRVIPEHFSDKQRLRTSSSLLGHGAPRETDL